MAKETCEWHKEGIWIEDEMHWCSGCNTELVDATEECRGAVRAVLAAAGATDFDFEPALAEFARTRKQ